MDNTVQDGKESVPSDPMLIFMSGKRPLRRLNFRRQTCRCASLILKLGLYITLEDGMAELGKVLTELKQALSESFVCTLNKRTEEIWDESRRYFVENFSKLVWALESFERRAEYIEANLQFLIEESNQGIVGVEQREQSTLISIIPPVVKSGGGIQVQVDKKNSLAGFLG